MLFFQTSKLVLKYMKVSVSLKLLRRKDVQFSFNMEQSTERIRNIYHISYRMFVDKRFVCLWIIIFMMIIVGNCFDFTSSFFVPLLGIVLMHVNLLLHPVINLFEKFLKRRFFSKLPCEFFAVCE